jgi:hypothetical protein
LLAVSVDGPLRRTWGPSFITEAGREARAARSREITEHIKRNVARR